MSTAELRRWLAERRAAEQREQDAQRRDMLASSAMQRALDLIDVVARVHGWPRPEDEQDRAEAVAAYTHWARLRAALQSRE
jgi:hypothetical protein